mgnify:CR=1 FL=1
MKNTTSESPAISPKFAGAIFFAVYALLFMLFAKYTLLSLRDTALLPFFSSILIAAVTGAFTGALFGGLLAKKSQWTRPFLMGIPLACLSLILGSLGIMIHYALSDPALLNRLGHWHDYLVLYGVILLSLVLTIGVWLVPITGIVSIYFNRHFFPGLRAADQQRLATKKPNKPDVSDEH